MGTFPMSMSLIARWDISTDKQNRQTDKDKRPATKTQRNSDKLTGRLTNSHFSLYAVYGINLDL
jgi:hypothetical protein